MIHSRVCFTLVCVFSIGINCSLVELKKFLDCQDLEKMNRKELSHTPSLVLIYKFLKKWQASNAKSDHFLPSNSKEKDQLRSLIKDSMEKFKASLSNDEEAEVDLINFQESIRGLNTALVSSRKIPSETQELLDSCSSSSVKNKFWVMVRALKKFVEEKGHLPIRGTIPDMTSDSTRYITLQRIYGNKFREDVSFFISCLSSVLEQSQSLSLEDFHENDIKTFCRNAQFLKVIKTPALIKEYPSKDVSNNGQSNRSAIKELVAAEDLSCDIQSSLNLYLMFRSLSRFQAKFNRDPGANSDIDEDVFQLKTCFKDLLSEEFHVNNASIGTREEFLQQITTFGGSEVHAISSIVGAIAAHEAIKLITHQFVPIDSTLIFDGINCHTEYVSLF